MLKSHEKFHSVNGKRMVLVVDDEAINREILRTILQASYELLFASDGTEALAAIQANKDTLSLVLLDLIMPGMNGMDVLKQAKADANTAHIPVIVTTSDQDSEVESLTNGAIDFIPKPYPQAGIILARIQRSIELAEDRQIINSTERDELTGLYNREYFYKYAEQYDQYHKRQSMDAIVVDINHFHMINERFGTAYGDSVLRHIGETLRESVADSGGIVCRRDADVFLIYCPHGYDYATILENTSVVFSRTTETSARMWLRMGVYADVDKSLDIERRFDRAKMAADSVQGSFTKTIGIYDYALHEKEIYSEQLIENFETAIEEHQFKVYYQPKFALQTDPPILVSAEALVRWQHPTLGMVSPGDFVPLFEENGLIQRLDQYVWNAAAAAIRDWKDRFGYAVPISVNVSRVDMYDPNLIDVFTKIIADNGIEAGELLLEITESAYTQDSEQIIETVTKLRSLGLRVEMDDFGTGFSSLNMISTLPIDALKLDMLFIKNAFANHGNIRLLEIIIDIADYLSVPIIAEGVETKEQVDTLRKLGCDSAQGYYFSKAVPKEGYERFLIDRINLADIYPLGNSPMSRSQFGQVESTISAIAQALSADYICIYCVNIDTDHFIEYSSSDEYKSLGLDRMGVDFFESCAKHMEHVVHPEDASIVLETINKDYLLTKLEKDKALTLTYRIMMEGQPFYVHLKATFMKSKSGNFVVIGISDINKQVLREREYGKARRMADKDALTGVKNRYVLTEDGKRIDAAIGEGTQEPFAVALCDVNGLDTVNGKFGRDAGDAYLKQACNQVCRTFAHSPVYRIGDSEFAALLREDDYRNRDDLAESINSKRTSASEGIGLTSSDGEPLSLIMCSIAAFEPGTDTSLANVFERAHAEIRTLKGPSRVAS